MLSSNPMLMARFTRDYAQGALLNETDSNSLAKYLLRENPFNFTLKFDSIGENTKY